MRLLVLSGEGGATRMRAISGVASTGRGVSGAGSAGGARKERGTAWGNGVRRGRTTERGGESGGASRTTCCRAAETFGAAGEKWTANSARNAAACKTTLSSKDCGELWYAI